MCEIHAQEPSSDLCDPVQVSHRARCRVDVVVLAEPEAFGLVGVSVKDVAEGYDGSSDFKDLLDLLLGRIVRLERRQAVSGVGCVWRCREPSHR